MPKSEQTGCTNLVNIATVLIGCALVNNIRKHFKCVVLKHLKLEKIKHYSVMSALHYKFDLGIKYIYLRD